MNKMSNETYAPASDSPNATGGCCGGARKNVSVVEQEARYHELRTLIAALRATDHELATPAAVKKSCCCG